MTVLPPPLSGIRVLELGGLGPIPFTGMLLADMGADVVRLVRPAPALSPDVVSARGKTHLELDLRDESAIGHVRELAAAADVVLEGFRPGTVERWGLGPDELLTPHPSLVYGRMSGWGRTGPWAGRPGHDINYVGLTGALWWCRDRTGDPVPPPGLVGDFGSAAVLTTGILAALLSSRTSGRGDVVDGSIVAGAAILTAPLWGMSRSGRDAMAIARGEAPYYGTYRCSDDRHVAVGAVEPQFYAALCDGLGLTGPTWDDQHDVTAWPQARTELEELFATRTRDAWIDLLPGDACVTPVLSPDEAADHRQAAAAGVFTAAEDGTAPAATPGFADRTPSTNHTHLTSDIASVRERWSNQNQKPSS